MLDDTSNLSAEDKEATALADAIAPLVAGKYTPKILGAAFGLLLYRVGYASAMEDVDNTVLVALTEGDDDGIIEDEPELDCLPPITRTNGKVKPN